MPSVTFRLRNGTETTIEVKPGESVMHAGAAEGIRGLLADCGGSCSCATCHVYVSEEFLDRMPPLSEIEDEMLEGVAAERRNTSRLSCQVPVTDALDGLVVTIPDRQ